MTEEELKEDFEILELSQNHLEKIVSGIEGNEDFKKQASKEKKPFENSLKNLDWRVDERKYLDGTKEKIAVVEFLLSTKGEKEAIQLDFSLKSLKHLISLLNKIEKEL